ncbi:MAG: hypothetical protein V1767_00885 [Chloroflexota bacterium]
MAEIPGPRARRDAADELTERLRHLRPAGQSKDEAQKEGQPPRKMYTYDDALAEEEHNAALEIKRLTVEEQKARHEANIKKAQDEVKRVSRDGEEREQKPEVKKWTLVGGKPVEDPEGDYNTLAQALLMAESMIRWDVGDDGLPIEDPDGRYRTYNQALRAASLLRQDQNVKKWTLIDGKPIEAPEGEYASYSDAYRAAYLDIERKRTEVMAAAAAAAKKPEESDTVKALATDLRNLQLQLADAVNPFKIMQKAKILRDEFMDSGLIPVTPPSPNTGDSIETVKENNRHTEEMEKLKTEKTYKESIADTLANGTRLVGEGISQDILKGVLKKPAESGMESFKCDKCGTTITVGPGALAVKCPKCGQVFRKDQPDLMADAKV